MKRKFTARGVLALMATAFLVAGYIRMSVSKDSGVAADNFKGFLFTGFGEQTADAFDEVATKAPLLTEVVFKTQSVLSRSVSQSNDDAEEKSTGKMTLGSADLELVVDTSNQQIGLRFQNITIPRGSTITQAAIQFKVDEATSDAVSLNIFGELVANAKTFSSSRNDISTRPLTSASVTWAPPAWNTPGEVGPDQGTPNLAPIIQEIVNQQGWISGNAIVITVSGSGKRVAESFDGTFAPRLYVAYRSSESDPSPADTADTFACFDSAGDIVVINETNRTERYEAIAAKGRVFDARTASFRISETSHGIIVMDGDASQTGMCWAGGYVSGDKPWNASWDDWKYDPQVRNSTVINNDAVSATVTGMHFSNVHDGPRISNAPDWTVQHVWGESIRDDCIENDHLHSGQVLDSLFDGCYTGISTRPSRSNTSADGRGEVVTLDGVLLRLEASPYPYEYKTKPGIIDKNGNPWDGTGIPYGHGHLFKYDENDVDRNVHFVIKNSVFLLPHDHVATDKLSLPPEELIDELSNVTVIWLGSGSFPGDLPTDKFPNGVTVLTGQTGLDFWKEKVTDWHRRHPDVDPARKPADPGTVAS